MKKITAKFHSFISAPKILSGVDSRKGLGAEIKSLEGNVVFVCTQKKVVDGGWLVDILESISKNNIAYVIFDGIDGNPTVTAVEHGVKTFRNEQCDILVAVGDSKVIDTAKAISYMAGYTFTVNCENSSAARPYIIAVPTSFGIGAGVLGNSIMDDAEKNSKALINVPAAFSKEVILDPILLQSMSLQDAALSGMVTLAHAIEGYVSTDSFELTNLLNFKSIQLIAKYLRRFTANRKNLDAASAMQNAFLYSALGSLNSGLGNVDAMAKALYVHWGINYDLACAVALPVVMEFNAIACPEKFIEIAGSFGENIDFLPPQEAALKAVGAIRKLARDIGVPAQIDGIKVTDHEVELISKEIIEIGHTQKNPRDTGSRDMLILLKKVLGNVDI